MCGGAILSIKLRNSYLRLSPSVPFYVKGDQKERERERDKYIGYAVIRIYK